MALLPAHYLHLVLASIWLGFLVGGLLVSRMGASRVVDYHKAFAPIALASLLLAGLLGLYLATFYGGPGEWFRFGTFTGRIGEKMISFIILLALGGYLHHGIVAKKLGREGDKALRTYRVTVSIAIIVTLGTMMLGTMIAEGA